MDNENMVSSRPPALGKVSGDQEVWLRERLTDLVNLSTTIYNSSKLGANAGMIEGALEGAINRQALEIINLLNLEPSYVNLPQRSWWVSDAKTAKNLPFGNL